MESNYTDTISGEELYINVSRYSFGSKYYYKDREKTIRHRVDGPAVDKVNGYKAWYANGKVHRIDGSAIEHSDGDKAIDKAWYINGVFIFAVDKNNKLVDRMK
jgi:hypothetical protein